MATNNYKMSFTTGGLFTHESIVIVGVYQNLQDWKETRNQIVGQNLLQARTESSLKRVTREATFRLQVLTENELEFFQSAQPEEQAYLLWLAVCRYYRFIAEFAFEVLHERYFTMKGDLHHLDFDIFFDQKAELDNELAQITPTTRKKLRQVLFRMMREAGMLDKKYNIQPALFSPHLYSLISSGNRQELSYFPLVENPGNRNFA